MTESGHQQVCRMPFLEHDRLSIRKNPETRSAQHDNVGEEEKDANGLMVLCRWTRPDRRKD